MSPCIGFSRGLKSHPILAGTFGFEFAWLEGLTGASLCWLSKAVGGWDNLTEWPSGRIFGQNGEYRWRSIGKGVIHAVIILDQGGLPDCFNTPPPLALDSQTLDSLLILWGEWINPDQAKGENPNGESLYYANEIPSAQRYPLNGNRSVFENAAKKSQTPRLLVRRYRIQEASGKLPSEDETPRRSNQHPRGEFVRCVGFDLSTEI
jgi:hypothetical protein